MIENPVIQAMLNRKSVRKYKKDQPSDEVVETVARAGQQAPFASQLYSILLTRKKKASFGAPLWFTAYSWTEHISRKWGQWDTSPDEWLAEFQKPGFGLEKKP